MTIAFSSLITYAKAQSEDTKVRLQFEGKTIVTKGMFDYFATPFWLTDWRVYDPYGRLIYEDDRTHAVVPLSTRDEAFDKFSVRVEKHSYYNVWLRGRFGAAVGEFSKKPVVLGVVPVPGPSPEPPEPTPPEPTPPEPVPPPVQPSPVPGEGEEEEKFNWTPLIIGGAVILGLTMMGDKKK